MMGLFMSVIFLKVNEMERGSGNQMMAMSIKDNMLMIRNTGKAYINGLME